MFLQDPGPCPLLAVERRPLEGWMVWAMLAVQIGMGVPVGFVTGWIFYALVAQ